MKKIDRSKIAILLNDNARNVNDSVKKEVESLIPRENIFYTKSLEEADITIAKILNEGYTHVFTGGGDGTLVYFLNRMKEIKKTARLKVKLPVVGILRLGTGNAVAIYTNSGKKIADDLKTILKGGAYKTQKIPLIKVNDKYFTFGGFGIDALVLNDYDNVKKTIKNRLLRWPFIGLKGYFTVAIGITLPKTFFSKRPIIEIYANSDNVYRASFSKGFEKIEVKKGDLIFKGPFSMLVLGTTPYYGYGLKLLPFVGKKERTFQVKIINLHPVQMPIEVLRAWNGKYESNSSQDFLFEDVTVKFSEDVPFQIAGEAAGYIRETRISLSHEDIDFIEFRD
ncbi:hypothetical protein JXR93_00195 [bacterium]|nr:hypothetical protein [bacterium]